MIDVSRDCPSVSAELFRQTMRLLPSAVSVVTVRQDDRLTGFTATSVSSFSAEPPTLLVCINRSSSSWGLLQDAPAFAVNVLGAGQDAIADRFAGRYGHVGGDRFDHARWATEDIPLLTDALVTIQCVVDDIIERHSHAIVLGRVTKVGIGDVSSSLLYWRGRYERLGWTDEELSNAVGFCPETWPIRRPASERF